MQVECATELEGMVIVIYLAGIAAIYKHKILYLDMHIPSFFYYYFLSKNSTDSHLKSDRI